MERPRLEVNVPNQDVRTWELRCVNHQAMSSCHTFFCINGRARCEPNGQSPLPQPHASARSKRWLVSVL